ncbi:BON domain-containing protein [Thioalkalicoccus limnaeus]|uniref:BON domain-containing protein n=1 Tax=Thioalkalicoccus limnaeus TaxID=120681 RepID=A0ABV4BHD5_9GAMM
MNSSTRVSLIASLTLALAFATAGCQQEGPAERTGQKIDQAAEETGAKMEGAKDTLGEKADRTGQYLDDAMITAKVKAEILADPLLEVLQISVTTTNGTVNLSGVVDSQQSLDRILEIAHDLDGVRSVESELVVEGSE